MSKFKEIINSWREKHKLSYTNDETFFVKWSINVSIFNIVTLVLLYSILLGFIVYLLILFTPLKKVVFDDVSIYDLNSQYEENVRLIGQLEREISQNEHYLSDLYKILNGEDFADTSFKEMDTLEGFINVNFETNAADSILRQEIEQERFSPEQTEKLTKETGFFVPPVSGTISRSLNRSERHYGVDIVTKADEPIKATLEGVVLFAEWTNRQGHVIIIQHTNHIISAYKHCSVLLKKPGDYVESGDPIAIVGNTGELTDGPHLHFEIWQDGVVLNPQEFINF